MTAVAEGGQRARLARLNLAQRVVIVVAWGAALVVIAAFVTSARTPFTGWTGYAPLQSAPLGTRYGLDGLESLGLWLGIVIVWAIPSAIVLRPRSRRADAESQHPQ